MSEMRLVGGLVALAMGWAAAAYVFRDSLGLVVFLILGVATLAQLIRVTVLRGKRWLLGSLWSALKDAFWGM